MNRTRLLIDTNVVLDLILERKPFVNDAIQILALAEAGRIELALSTDAVCTVFSIVSKNKDTKTARQAITMLLDFVTLASLDERTVLRGLALDFSDIEDALAASVADSIDARAIITRNVKDFKKSPVPALTPAEFLASWAEKEKLQAEER